MDQYPAEARLYAGLAAFGGNGGNPVGERRADEWAVLYNAQLIENARRQNGGAQPNPELSQQPVPSVAKPAGDLSLRNY